VLPSRLAAALFLSALSARPPAAAAAAARPAPRDKPLRFTCPEAFADGALTDPGQAGPLAVIAASLKWEGGDPYGVPADCHRQVRLFCGPDLDRDGDAEAIVVVSWSPTDGCTSTPAEGGESPAVTKIFLASRHGLVWRGVAPLAAGSNDQTAYFVRRPRGEIAIRVQSANVASDSGCGIGRYEVFALRSGALRKVDAGDSSRACAPCGCDHHP
jgi:hypothetical protein